MGFCDLIVTDCIEKIKDFLNPDTGKICAMYGNPICGNVLMADVNYSPQLCQPKHRSARLIRLHCPLCVCSGVTAGCRKETPALTGSLNAAAI